MEVSEIDKKLKIGVIISDCSSESVTALMQGITAQASLAQCNLTVLTSIHGYHSILQQQFPAESELLCLGASDSFDGYIYDRNYFQHTNICKKIDAMLRKTGKPVMLLDCGENDYFENTVAHDFESFEELTEHLITFHGYQRIYCLTGPKGNIQAEERLQGYLTAMNRHQLPCDESMYQYGDFWKNSPVILAKKIISHEIPTPEAVMCGNDIMADTLIVALKASELQVPKDIAVTGYDGTFIGEKSGEILTTYQKSNFQLGTEALCKLYGLITGKQCRRVRNSMDGIMIGTTCGCTLFSSENPKSYRHRKEGDSSEQRLMHSNMLMDLLDAESLEELLMNLSCYTYLNYGWKSFRLFLSQNYLNTLCGEQAELTLQINTVMKEVCRLDFAEKNELNHETLPAFSIPDRLCEGTKLPATYYLVPLTHRAEVMGIAAISFGNQNITFSSNYTYFITYISAALEQLRLKSHRSSASEKAEHQNPLYISLSAIRLDMQKHPELPRNIDTLSQQIHVSRSYLQRMYHHYFGCSVLEDLIRFRIDKAKQLLSETDLSITEISLSCGYSNYSHFVHQFKSIVNMTPSAYRNHKQHAQ